MAPARVDRFFRMAQLASSALLSLAHGGNDAQKTMGIIVGLLVSVRPLMAAQTGICIISIPGDGVPLWVEMTAYTAISLGTLFGGWRIVHTMGSRITKLRPVSGFAAETGGAQAPGNAPIAGPQALQLAPFSETETAAAVSCLLPAADPFTIASINDASGGNALFIEELCHSVASGAADEKPAQGSPWLDNLIGARLSRLPPAQADLVRAGAMIGRVIPAWLFEQVTGHSADDPLVTGLAAEDFIFPGEREGTLRFKHGITREAVYGSVGLRERRALHLAIADALRGRGAEEGEEPPYEALAYHFGAAGDDAETALYAELAGDKAVAVSALDRAQVQYKAALAALDRLPASDEGSYRWGRIAQRFGLAGVFDPSRDQLPIFERAVERAGQRRDEAALAWAEYWLGYINYALGEISDAIRHCERGLAAACRVEDDPLAVQIRATLGQARAAAADYDEALALLDEAIAVKRRHRTGAKPPIGFAYSLSCKGFALGDLGRFRGGARLFRGGDGGDRRRPPRGRGIGAVPAQRGLPLAGPAGRGPASCRRSGPRLGARAHALSVRDEPRARRLCALAGRRQPGRDRYRPQGHRLARGKRPRPIPVAQLRLAGADAAARRPHRGGPALRRPRGPPRPPSRPARRSDGLARDGARGERGCRRGALFEAGGRRGSGAQLAA